MKIVMLIGWILVVGENHRSCDGFHHRAPTIGIMGWFKTATTTIGKEIEESKLSSL